MLKTGKVSVTNLLRWTSFSQFIHSTDSRPALNTIRLCSYCTKVHKQDIIVHRGHNLNSKLLKIGQFSIPAFNTSKRYYPVDSRLKKVDTGKVPLAKTAAVRRQRKRTVEDSEVTC